MLAYAGCAVIRMRRDIIGIIDIVAVVASRASETRLTDSLVWQSIFGPPLRFSSPKFMIAPAPNSPSYLPAIKRSEILSIIATEIRVSFLQEVFRERLFQDRAP